MITLKRALALCGALLLSSSALANVTYRWVGDSANTGYASGVQVEITLSDKRQYSGTEIGCLAYSTHPCFNQPTLDLVSVSFGVNYEWMTLDPRNNRYAGTGWDVHVIGGDTLLSGFITAYDWSNSIEMFGTGEQWTIHRIGSDRGLVLEDVTGRFEMVPEPGQLMLMVIGLAGLIAVRRKVS